MEQQENKIQGETRAFKTDGKLINNTFLYLDESTGKYEFRSLKEHLTDLGLLDEKAKELDIRTKDLDNRMQILSNKLNLRLNSIN